MKTNSFRPLFGTSQLYFIAFCHISSIHPNRHFISMPAQWIVIKNKIFWNWFMPLFFVLLLKIRVWAGLNAFNNTLGDEHRHEPTVNLEYDEYYYIFSVFFLNFFFFHKTTKMDFKMKKKTIYILVGNTLERQTA